MTRLPLPGSDDGTWGSLLNDFLLAAHTPIGDLKTGIVSEVNLDSAAQAKLNAAAAGAVSSVNNRTGAVTLAKSDVGLGSVDNTADLAKPISTATQTALATKADSTALATHTSNLANPHAVTKAQVGLGSVQNQALIVLGPSDPIPAGTPTGTVVIRLS